MTKRERLEDLGRITEMISAILEEPILFDRNHRPKDAWGEFSELDENAKVDYITDMSYAIQRLDHALSEVWAVARGDDE